MSLRIPRRSKRLVFLPWAIAVVLVFVGAIVVLRALFWKPQPPALPYPNGYDDLVRAGESVVGQAPDPETASAAALRAFVEQNSTALELAQFGLRLECAVPVEYSTTYLNNTISQRGTLRQVARLFVSRGRLAELEGRTTDAVDSYLDAIRLGQKISHGGLSIDALTGSACALAGLNPLQKLRSQLTPAECRRLIAALESVYHDREPCESVVAQERAYYQGSTPHIQRLALDLSGFAGRAQLQNQQLVQDALGRSEATLLLLQADLAIRAHRLDKGSLPPSLEALVPDYLSSVPRDPFGVAPLVYRLDKGAYLLYSIGPDRKDDRGAVSKGRPLAGTQKQPGDLMLDP